jgi:hypothetical protein
MSERMALSHDEWVAEGKPTQTAFRGQIQVGSDYLRLVHALMDDGPLQIERCEVEGENHIVTVHVTTGKGARHDTAAAVLLQERWFYDWLPIGTRVVFVSFQPEPLVEVRTKAFQMPATSETWPPPEPAA